MTPHKWQKEIIHWVNGGEVEEEFLPGGDWYISHNPDFDSPWRCFRIRDPYSELKAAAKDPTKQIRSAVGRY